MPTGIYKRTEWHRKINSDGHKGKKLSIEHRQRLSDVRKGKRPKNSLAWVGKNHPQWRGDKVGYRALHEWVEKQLGRPNRCSHCGNVVTGRKVQWANKSGKYLRNISDWIRLCGKCHYRHDAILREIKP